jgi:hypothetical protein
MVALAPDIKLVQDTTIGPREFLRIGVVEQLGTERRQNEGIVTCIPLMLAAFVANRSEQLSRSTIA